MRYRNPIRLIVGPLYGLLWLGIIIIYLATGAQFWILFLIGAFLSICLSVLVRLITAGIIGAGLFGAASMLSNQQRQQPYQGYQPPYQGYQPPPAGQVPYQQGYPPQQPYQEGGQPQYYQPPAQYQPPQTPYEQPQVQYPGEMPPPTQG